MKIFILFVLFFSAVINMTFSSPKKISWKFAREFHQELPFTVPYKSMNLKKEINSIVHRYNLSQDKQIKDLMKKRIERILAYSEFEPYHWWIFTHESGECINAQMEIEEYLQFLQEEKNKYQIRENKKAHYIKIKVLGHHDDPDGEITYWSKDRYQCETNIKRSVYRD